MRLKPGQALGLGRRRLLLRVLSGIVWVTVEGDSRDYVLRAGEAMRLDGRGRAAVQALREATILARDATLSA